MCLSQFCSQATNTRLCPVVRQFLTRGYSAHLFRCNDVVPASPGCASVSIWASDPTNEPGALARGKLHVAHVLESLHSRALRIRVSGQPSRCEEVAHRDENEPLCCSIRKSAGTVTRIGAHLFAGRETTMLRVLGGPKRLCNGLTRRDLLSVGGLSLLGATLGEGRARHDLSSDRHSAAGHRHRSPEPPRSAVPRRQGHSGNVGLGLNS